MEKQTSWNMYIDYLHLVEEKYPRFRVDYTIGIILFIFVSLLQSLIPYSLGKLVDSIKNNDLSNLPAYLFFLLLLVSKVIDGFTNLVNSYITAKCESAISFGIFKKINNTSYQNQRTIDSGEVVSNIRRSSETFGNINYSIFGIIIPTLAGIVFSSYFVALTTSIEMAVSFLTMTIIIFFTVYIISKKTKFIYDNLYNSENKIFSYLTERLLVLKDIKINNATDAENNLAKDNFSTYEKNIFKANFTLQLINSGQNILIIIGISFFIYLSLTMSYGLGAIVMLITYMFQMTMPIMRLSQTILSLRGDLTSLNFSYPYLKFKSHNYFNNIAYNYDEKIIFNIKNLSNINHNNISLKINSGGFYIITSPSGTGKTYFLETLLGIINGYEGKIHFLGKELKDMSSNDIFNHISYIPQNPTIINDTVRRNLLLSGSMISDNEIKNVLDSLLLNKIYLRYESFNSFLDSAISKNNKNISGGEKQRLMIARALLRNKSIIVMDEATSALDKETEEIILTYVRSKVNTVIMVSHNTVIKNNHISIKIK